MDSLSEGLRCQDVTLGSRLVDPNSSSLVKLEKTRLVGMAADLAGLLKGRNVVNDIESLKIISAENLDINVYAFNQVISLLEEAEFIEVDRDQHGNPTRIIERVPLFKNLYEELGAVWRSSKPTGIEEALVILVDRLAGGPMPLEALRSDLGFTREDVDVVYDVGTKTSVIKSAASTDGQLLYSPFTAFENPGMMTDTLIKHGPAQLADALAEVRDYQGLPVNAQTRPVLADAVALGLVTAPAVVLPDNQMMSFATVPYNLDRALFLDQKMILDKALSILACIRCGQSFGGHTNADNPQTVLMSLRDSGYLSEHSSHERQYKLLTDLGVVHLLPDSKPGGSWYRVGFIDTPENRRALEIALDLLNNNEIPSGRKPSDDVKNLLDISARSLRPLQTTARRQRTGSLGPENLRTAMDAIYGVDFS